MYTYIYTYIYIYTCTYAHSGCSFFFPEKICAKATGKTPAGSQPVLPWTLAVFSSGKMEDDLPISLVS